MSEFANEVEIDINIANAMCDEHAALTRLYNNKDFQDIVLEGYFVQKAADVVWQKATPAMRSSEQQAALVRVIDSIGEFQMYLNAIEQRGVNARMAIDDGNEALDQMAGETH